LEDTQALALGGLAALIYINGSPQDQQQTATKITDELLSEFGPGSAQKLISKITTGSKLYGSEKQNPYLPNLVIEYRRGVSSRLNPGGTDLVTTDQATGTHSPQGFLLANGPTVKSNTKRDADIIDIAPTILAYFGIPIPDHIDGKVLADIFGESLSIIYEHLDITKSQTVEYSDSQQSAVEQQLKDLGYL
jgi:predicted AlkP superfamily phosphohydrolase/phosphomutase